MTNEDELKAYNESMFDNLPDNPTNEEIIELAQSDSIKFRLKFIQSLTDKQIIDEIQRLTETIQELRNVLDSRTKNMPK